MFLLFVDVAALVANKVEYINEPRRATECEPVKRHNAHDAEFISHRPMKTSMVFESCDPLTVCHETGHVFSDVVHVAYAEICTVRTFHLRK